MKRTTVLDGIDGREVVQEVRWGIGIVACGIADLRVSHNGGDERIQGSGVARIWGKLRASYLRWRDAPKEKMPPARRGAVLGK